MTADERFERIEHVTAGLAEQARQDREESRQLWRETQRQLNTLTMIVDRFILEAAARDRESHERDQALNQRIEALVSAIGAFIIARGPQ